MPLSSNQKVFDSFIVLDNELFIFQSTTADTHDMKSGLIEFFARCTKVPAQKNRKFVFIIDDRKLICPSSKEVPRLNMYSTEIHVKKLNQDEDENENENEETKTKKRK